MRLIHHHRTPWFVALLLASAVGGPAAAESSGQAGSPAQQSPAMQLPRQKNPEPGRWVSGQPGDDQLRSIAAFGIRHVINLRPPEEFPSELAAAELGGLGVGYHRLPIHGADDLTRENAEQLDALLGKIGDEPTLLHCASGNRAGALMSLRAAWIQGLPVEEALELGRRYGLTGLEPVVREKLSAAGKS
ncbi:MAG: sulfur transferase domain-containing protein [Stagnimonas sp.]|nr:sulfur transferase domain-containing protein [Stagnimonas sp.]